MYFQWSSNKVYLYTPYGTFAFFMPDCCLSQTVTLTLNMTMYLDPLPPIVQNTKEKQKEKSINI